MIKDKIIEEYLKCGFDKALAVSEFDFICDIVFNISEIDIILEKNLPDNFEQKLSDIIKKRLETKRPIQQIAGFAYFMNEKYIVDENVLIPRPETELLVLKAKEIIEKNNFKSILDIGTGTGCITVGLLKLLPEIKATSVDISEKALKIAERNAALHKVSERLTLKQSDLFSDVKGKFDIIISNPPYIPKNEKPFLQQEVRDFEPEIALFAKDEEGIEFYKKIISRSHRFLNKNGYLMFETGYNQGKHLEKLFKENSFVNFQLIQDLDKNDRVVSGQLNYNNFEQL